MPCRANSRRITSRVDLYALGFSGHLVVETTPNRFWFNSTDIRKTILKIAEDVNNCDTHLGREVQKRNPTAASKSLVTVSCQAV